MQDMGYFEGNNWLWKVGFYQAVVTSEASDQVRELEMILHDLGTIAGSSDCFKWFKYDNGLYSVSSGYTESIKMKLFQPQCVMQQKATLMLWGSSISSRIKVFGWICVRNLLETKDLFARRGIITDDTEKVCVFCNQSSESLVHLLVQCKFSKLV